MKLITNEKPVNLNQVKKTRKKQKKLPNKFGSIKKLSGNRSKPYAAYPPVVEFKDNGAPVAVPAVDYYEDWYTAFDALREYNKALYDLKSRDITFKEVFNNYYKDASCRSTIPSKNT